jgi:hypothetical protein
MKKQNKKIFYYRDLLEKHLKKKELEALLDHNNQEIPTGQVSSRGRAIRISIRGFGFGTVGTFARNRNRNKMGITKVLTETV